MKAAKVFFLLMLALVICILIFDWVRINYFADEVITPIARIKTIFVVIVGTIIMKISTTPKGFKIFIISYLGLLAIYYILNFMATHTTYRVKFADILSFYKELIPLETPLPFIFFWLVDRLFFVEGQNIFKTPGQ